VFYVYIVIMIVPLVSLCTSMATTCDLICVHNYYDMLLCVDMYKHGYYLCSMCT
jgi:hypothetical protein